MRFPADNRVGTAAPRAGLCHRWVVRFVFRRAEVEGRCRAIAGWPRISAAPSRTSCSTRQTGRRTAKVLTTSRAPETGVFEALDLVLEQAGAEPGDIDVFVHGTTLATNALIERKGARTAFLTTRGFRDVLEMGFEKRFEQYDIFMDKPDPLVPRPLRREVDERVTAGGEVVVSLDAAGVRDVAAEWREGGHRGRGGRSPAMPTPILTMSRQSARF